MNSSNLQYKYVYDDYNENLQQNKKPVMMIYPDCRAVVVKATK